MTQVQQLFIKEVDSPLGMIRCVANTKALVGAYLEAQSPLGLEHAQVVETHEVLDHAADELAAYFQGACTSFQTPLYKDGTEFQNRVWDALLEIPFGETRSYGELAKAIGRPTAVRAVGTANGRNPLSIFVPCHRVIGANGKLTGYAGGLDSKGWLLRHEAR